MIEFLEVSSNFWFIYWSCWNFEAKNCCWNWDFCTVEILWHSEAGYQNLEYYFWHLVVIKNVGTWNWQSEIFEWRFEWRFGSNVRENVIVIRWQCVKESRLFFISFFWEFNVSVEFWKLYRFGCVASSNGYANFQMICMITSKKPMESQEKYFQFWLWRSFGSGGYTNSNGFICNPSLSLGGIWRPSGTNLKGKMTKIWIGLELNCGSWNLLLMMLSILKLRMMKEWVELWIHVLMRWVTQRRIFGWVSWLTVERSKGSIECRCLESWNNDWLMRLRDKNLKKLSKWCVNRQYRHVKVYKVSKVSKIFKVYEVYKVMALRSGSTGRGSKKKWRFSSAGSKKR